jgi:N-methylhydantoinase B
VVPSGVEVKIVWERLSGAVNLATVVQKQSAFSTAVTEANDFACGLMTKNGDLVASSDISLPSFSLMMPNAVRRMLKKECMRSPEPGDIYVWNDPWHVSAQLNDILIVRPIFWKDSIQGYAGSIAHNPELGAVKEWMTASDVFEEGLQIPALRLFRRGTRDDSIWQIIGANSRAPEQTLGDIEAQVVAVGTITDRVSDVILHEHGEGLDVWASEILGRSEELMKRSIGAVPNGVYSIEDVVDARDVGVEGEEDDLVFRVSVEINDEDLVVSYEGTSPQVELNVNSLETFTSAYTMYALRTFLCPGVRQNDGFTRPVEIVVPEGTLLNAVRPAACFNRHMIGQRTCDLLSRALAPVLPERVHGVNGSAPGWVTILTPLEGDLRDVPRLSAFAGGTGARHGQDGQTVHYPANLSSTPVEVMERTLPIRVVEKRIREGSGGDGAWHGGDGQSVEILIEGPLVYLLMAGHIEHEPQGVLGGGSGASGEFIIDGVNLPPGSGRLTPGSRVIIRTPGGGGYGTTEEDEKVSWRRTSDRKLVEPTDAD